MQYVLGNMLNGGGGLNADGLALDLQFALDKTLTARKGPTPTFTRASSGTFVGSDGLIHGVDTSTTSNTIGTGSRTFTLNATAGQDQFWRAGNAVEASNGSNFMVGTVTSYDAATQSLVCNMTSIGGSGTFTSWRIGYRGPRFDHTDAGVCRGLLIEESRTNLVFPSDALTTQTRTVTAVAHTLSFYGTGTVVLSGAHSATVVGTGAYPTRTTLTFTPTAGSLTLTVTGSVTQAQLEAGSFATSYIPTTTGTVVRSADVCSISAVPFATFYNPAGGTLATTQTVNTISTLATPEVCRIVGSVGQLQFGTTNLISEALRFFSVGSVTRSLKTGARASGVQFKTAMAFANNDLAACLDNGSVLTDTTTQNIPIGVSMTIGFNAACMHIARLQYFKKRLPNAKLQALTV